MYIDSTGPGFLPGHPFEIQFKSKYPDILFIHYFVPSCSEHEKYTTLCSIDNLDVINE